MKHDPTIPIERDVLIDLLIQELEDCARAINTRNKRDIDEAGTRAKMTAMLARTVRRV